MNKSFNSYEAQPIPWGMPGEVYEDITEGATVRRGQWALDNIPGVSIDEVKKAFVMQPDEVEKLNLAEEE